MIDNIHQVQNIILKQERIIENMNAKKNGRSSSLVVSRRKSTSPTHRASIQSNEKINDKSASLVEIDSVSACFQQSLMPSTETFHLNIPASHRPFAVASQQQIVTANEEKIEILMGGNNNKTIQKLFG